MIIALGLYVTSNDKLEVSVLFTSFQLVNSMTFPIMLIPNFINQIFKDLLSIQRLQNYLFTEEHHDRKKYENLEELTKNEILVNFQNVNFGIQEHSLDIVEEDDKIIKEIKSAKNLKLEMKNPDNKIYLNESNSDDDKEKNNEKEKKIGHLSNKQINSE